MWSFSLRAAGPPPVGEDEEDRDDDVQSMGGLNVDGDDDDVQSLNGDQGCRYSIASAHRSSAASQCDTVAYQEFLCLSPFFPPFSPYDRTTGGRHGPGPWLRAPGPGTRWPGDWRVLYTRDAAGAGAGRGWGAGGTGGFVKANQKSESIL